MADVFINYAEEERAIAEQIGGILPGFGYSTWFYHRDSVPGVAHLSTTKREIAAASIVVVIVSRAAFRSDFVQPEIFDAVAAGRTILPVLVDIAYAELQRQRPEWAKAFGFAAAVDWGDGEQAIVDILRGVIALLGERPRPPLDVNAQDSEGYTPLALCIALCNENDPTDVRKRTEMVSLLLQHGADPNLRTHDGRSPLAIAEAKGLTAITAALRASGAQE